MDDGCLDPRLRVQIEEVPFLHHHERVRRVKDRDIDAPIESAQRLRPCFRDSTRDGRENRPLITLDVVAFDGQHAVAVVVEAADS